MRFQKGKNLAQNIDMLFFAKNPKLNMEFDRLFWLPVRQTRRIQGRSEATRKTAHRIQSGRNRQTIRNQHRRKFFKDLGGTRGQRLHHQLHPFREEQERGQIQALRLLLPILPDVHRRAKHHRHRLLAAQPEQAPDQRLARHHLRTGMLPPR